MADRSSVLNCPKCRATLPADAINPAVPAPCPSCGLPVYVAAFPALVRPEEHGEAGKQLVMEDDASCFYHVDSRAETACQRCGRFLCKLCEIVIAGECMCPSCLESSKDKGGLKQIETQFVRYDQIALTVSIAPILLAFLWPFWIVTGPVSIFLSLRYWKRPLSILPVTKIRFVVALLAGLVQVSGWLIAVAGIAGVAGRF